jgi:hypothetical protein
VDQLLSDGPIAAESSPSYFLDGLPTGSPFVDGVDLPVDFQIWNLRTVTQIVVVGDGHAAVNKESR